VHDVAPKYGLAVVPAPLPPTQTGEAFGFVPAFGVGSKIQPTELKMFPELCAPPAVCDTSTSELVVSLLPKSSWFWNAYVQTTGSPMNFGESQFFCAPAPVSDAPAPVAPSVRSTTAVADRTANAANRGRLRLILLMLTSPFVVAAPKNPASSRPQRIRLSM
jgi:hypothetical protein